MYDHYVTFTPKRILPFNTMLCILITVFTKLPLQAAQANADSNVTYQYNTGAIVRGDVSQRALALVFTGDSFGDGGNTIRQTLAKFNLHGSFFLTGNFYRNPAFSEVIHALKKDGHYLGAHSDQHLLYCSWENRDSLLVTREQFLTDLARNYAELERFGIDKSQAPFFLPPFEWYNQKITEWTREFGLTLINFTHGTKSHTDWTIPEMPRQYVPSDTILNSILACEASQPHGLNGFILLTHIGSDPTRTDKFYFYLERLITTLLKRGYSFKRIDALLKP